jgi:hypothetical protein
VTTGLNAEQLPPAEEIDTGRMRDVLRRHLGQLFRSFNSRPPKLGDLPLFERAVALVEKLDAFEAEASAPAEATDGGGWEGWPRRMAEQFATEPDHFTEFLTLLFEADRARTGPLREQARQVLNALDPAGVPKWRGPQPDDDEIVL